MLGLVSQTLVASSEEEARRLRETLHKAGLMVTRHPKRPLHLIVTCQPTQATIVETVALRMNCSVKRRMSGAIRLSWPPVDASPRLVELLSRLRKTPPVFVGTPWSNAEVCAYELSAKVTLPRDLVELLYKFGEFSLAQVSINLGQQHDVRLRRLLPEGALLFATTTAGYVYASDLGGALGVGLTPILALAPDATTVDDAHVYADSVAASLLASLDGVDVRTAPKLRDLRP